MCIIHNILQCAAPPNVRYGLAFFLLAMHDKE